MIYRNFMTAIALTLVAVNSNHHQRADARPLLRPGNSPYLQQSGVVKSSPALLYRRAADTPSSTTEVDTIEYVDCEDANDNAPDSFLAVPAAAVVTPPSQASDNTGGNSNDNNTDGEEECDCEESPEPAVTSPPPSAYGSSQPAPVPAPPAVCGAYLPALGSVTKPILVMPLPWADAITCAMVS